MNKKLSGFTLIELIIAVSITFIVLTVVVLDLNPEEFISQSKDAQRISDLKRIDTALSLAQNSPHEFLEDNSLSNIVYISLSDKNNNINDDCKTSGEYPDLPPLAGGWQYRCVSVVSRLHYTDGNGWIPINFDSISGNPLRSLPIDPVNDEANYYTFSKLAPSINSSALAAPMQSEKYLTEAENDGGNLIASYETRPAGWVLPPSVPNTITLVDIGSGLGQYNHTSVAIGTDGFPIISYDNALNDDLKVAKCGNAACSAGNTITSVDTAGMVGDWSSIAIGADGLPIISYWDDTNSDLKVAKCGNAACSAGNTITSVDTAGSVGDFSSIAIGADGLPIISYRDGIPADLKVAKCGNAACSAGNIFTSVDAIGNTGIWTSIAIGADNLPVISYYDVTTPALRVAKCGNAACSAGNIFTSVDTVLGKWTSINIGADGLPIISYYDETNTDLKVAKCGNAACSAGNTITSVDTAGDIGWYSSIAIGADGLPIVSYYDATNLDLKVAKCGNVACSAGNTITSVDTAGDVGTWNFIAIGADGLPIIGYRDNPNNGLKVVKCGNAACNP